MGAFKGQIRRLLGLVERQHPVMGQIEGLLQGRWGGLPGLRQPCLRNAQRVGADAIEALAQRQQRRIAAAAHRLQDLPHLLLLAGQATAAGAIGDGPQSPPGGLGIPQAGDREGGGFLGNGGGGRRGGDQGGPAERALQGR